MEQNSNQCAMGRRLAEIKKLLNRAGKANDEVNLFALESCLEDIKDAAASGEKIVANNLWTEDGDFKGTPEERRVEWKKEPK